MRESKLSLSMTLAAIVASLPAPAVAKDHVVAQVDAAGAVHQARGEILLTTYDPAAQTYGLALTSTTGARTALPVPPSPVPIDADLGTDTRGRLALVWAQCRDAQRQVGCDIDLMRLDGTPAATVRGASTAASEYGPTLSRGRLAFVRRASPSAAPQVYVRLLTAPVRSRSRRLPTTPAFVPCDVRPGRCRTIPWDVEQLELRGRRLAVIVRYEVDALLYPGNSVDEVRLDDVATGRSRRVASVVTGEGGQEFLGASFAGSKLGVAFSCSERSFCSRRPTAYRFDVRGLHCERDTGSLLKLVRGFALLSGGRSIETRPDANSPEDLRPGPGRLVVATRRYRRC